MTWDRLGALMGEADELIEADIKAEKKSRLRPYSDILSADVNQKGVLDVDVVKGCTAGMSARPGTGCYGACYAASIAKFRGIDFTKAVTRTVHSVVEAKKIEDAVRHSPNGFFRIGTMGDPSHAWKETVETVEWLAPFAVPVIVTKHWRVADDSQLARLVKCGAILNTSVSALDTAAELSHRERQIQRYSTLGGVSVARIVSCEFNRDNPGGLRMDKIQKRLSQYPSVIDNPLRLAMNHPLVTSGMVKVSRVQDLASVRTISLNNPESYVGRCEACPDQCGLSSRGARHPAPLEPQRTLPVI